MLRMGAKVFLHIGTRKSGTSYVQWALRDTPEVLAGQGVDLTFRTRDGQVAQQLNPLREFLRTGDPADMRERNAALAERIRASGMTQLITLEDLAELPRPAVDLVMEGLSEFDVELIVTMRHWASVIPSEWQQSVKERYTGGYLDYVQAIRDGSAEAEVFLSRQDVPAILRRWGAALAPEKIHVLVVPSDGGSNRHLLELFCGIVGIDASTLRSPKARINSSLSLPQAEMLRRVNIELGDRLPDRFTTYAKGVREWLTRGSLMKHPGGKILLPTGYEQWCAEVAAEHRDAIVAMGVNVVGDVADMVPDLDRLETADPVVPDEEIAAHAVLTIADMAAMHWDERQVPAAPAAPAPMTMGRLARGVLRRARRVLPG